MRTFKSLRRDGILKLGRKSRKGFNKLMIGSSLVGDPPVFDSGLFPWIADLTEHAGDIRNEFVEILQRDSDLPAIEEISPDHSRIALEGRWRSVFLYGYGYRSAVICDRCPVTARILDAVPGLETAFFSVLKPGAHLPPHRGVTKAIITCHIPLIVPAAAENCWLRLDGTRHPWKPGQAFIFDDTRKHEVRNDTDDIRVVLLIHVRRPMRFPGSSFGNLFMWAVKASPFIKDGIANQKRWEQRFIEHGDDTGRTIPGGGAHDRVREVKDAE
jgi:beta-hydroxylase